MLFMHAIVDQRFWRYRLETVRCVLEHAAATMPFHSKRRIRQRVNRVPGCFQSKQVIIEFLTVMSVTFRHAREAIALEYILQLHFATAFVIFYTQSVDEYVFGVLRGAFQIACGLFVKLRLLQLLRHENVEFSCIFGNVLLPRVILKHFPVICYTIIVEGKIIETLQHIGIQILINRGCHGVYLFRRLNTCILLAAYLLSQLHVFFCQDEVLRNTAEKSVELNGPRPKMLDLLCVLSQLAR